MGGQEGVKNMDTMISLIRRRGWELGCTRASFISIVHAPTHFLCTYDLVTLLQGPGSARVNDTPAVTQIITQTVYFFSISL